MRAVEKVWLRLRTFSRRERVERELMDELQFHIDQQTQENIGLGMDPLEARNAALRSMGGIAQFQEQCRDARQMNAIEDLLKDIRYAVRVLWRTPAFTAVAILTLALGIGATAAIFSVVYGVLLKPLPFPEPDRLVGLYHRAPGINVPVVNQGPATYITYRENQQSFEQMGAWDQQEVSLTTPGQPERLRAIAVTHGLLPLLGVRPEVGRLLVESDLRAGTPPRVILSWGLWQRRFGGMRDAVGQMLEIDGRPAEIIGVLPASFRFLRNDPELVLPLQIDPADANRVSFGFQGVARLKRGVTPETANADVTRMISIVEQIPGFPALRLQAHVRPLADDVIGDVRQTLWIIFAAVAVVLLVACANVANLFLVRAEGRQGELAIRTALGANRLRIARALLVEALILGAGAGALGVVFAQGAIYILQSLAPATLPRVHEINIDWVVFLFTVAISTSSAIGFGLVPVLRLKRLDSISLKEGARGSSSGPGRQRTRNGLVVAEIAMAFVLLVVAGLMIRTFIAANQVQPGFAAPDQVQTFRIEVPEASVQDDVQMARIHEQISERIRRIPGVTDVALSSHITMDGEDNANPLAVEHVHVAQGGMPPLRRFKSIAPGYFTTMKNPLVAGRDFTWNELYGLRRIVIVSETVAREHWGSAAAALGKRVRSSGPDWYEIVGVAGSERDDGLNRPATSMVYWPLINQSYPRREIAYSVRSGRVGSSGFLDELRHAVWSVRPDLPLADPRSLQEIQAGSMAQTSFATVTLGVAAGVATVLGLVGIYGVIAYVATQRRREIGIRVALGAAASDVRVLFLRHGAALTIYGIALGVGAAIAVTRVLSTLLFGVSSLDPATFAAVSLGLAVVALLATWLPARRASRMDPVAALRAEG